MGRAATADLVGQAGRMLAARAVSDVRAADAIVAAVDRVKARPRVVRPARRSPRSVSLSLLGVAACPSLFRSIGCGEQWHFSPSAAPFHLATRILMR